MLEASKISRKYKYVIKIYQDDLPNVKIEKSRNYSMSAYCRGICIPEWEHIGVKDPWKGLECYIFAINVLKYDMIVPLHQVNNNK